MMPNAIRFDFECEFEQQLPNLLSIKAINPTSTPCSVYEVVSHIPLAAQAFRSSSVCGLCVITRNVQITRN